MKAIQFFTILFLSLNAMACKNDFTNATSLVEPIQFTEVEALSPRFIRVALLLDTSNSMDGLIDQAKAQLWEIVNELSYAKCEHVQPNLEIALYEYGNDRLNPSTGYLRKVLPFTNDLDAISKELFSLTTNGGSEYCGTVIKASLDQLDWGNNNDDLKMIFIAGNEPFTQGTIDFRDSVHQAKEKGIVVNTIFCGDYQHGVDTHWQEGARLAYGDYLAIDHNQKTIHIVSPYDDMLLQLNIQLNKTYVPYGYEGKKRYEMQQEQDDNAEGYGKANAVSRTVSKGSHLYKNSSWDLVDAIEEEKVSVAELETDQLPKELQGKSKKEIESYVNTQKKRREEIQGKIAELNQKRMDFIAQEKNKTTQGLGNAMLDAIRKQGKKKNYSWE